MSCSIQSSSLVVGAKSTFTFNIKPNVLIYSGNNIQISLPTWGAYNITNFVGTTNCTPSCTSSISNNT